MKNLTPEIQIKFKEFFGTSTVKFLDELVTICTGTYSFNIIKFDEWLHRVKGYSEDKHGSIKDFIKSNFAPGADELIKTIINYK